MGKRSTDTTELFRSLIENAPSLVTLLDRDGTVRYANSASRWMLGIAPDDLVDRRFSEHVHPEDADRLSQFLTGEAENDADQSRLELRVRHNDGSWRIFEATSYPPPTVTEDRVVCFCDVTERTESQRSLLQREQQLSLIFSNASVGIALVDMDGRFVEFNDAWLKMLGYEDEQLKRLTVADVTAPGEPTTLPTDNALDGDIHRLEKRYRRADGSEFWGDLCATVLRNDDGTPRGMIGIIVDITDRKRAEQALREEEVRYRMLFERNLAGVYRSDVDGTVLECNEAFAEMLGCGSVEEVTSRNAREFYPSDAARDNLLHELRRRAELKNHEMILVRTDGSPVWVLANINLADDEHGEPRILEGTMVDITDKKRVENRLLLHSKALESVSTAIVITDPEGIIQWVNPAFEWLTGYSAEEAVGQHTRILKSGRHPDAVYRELWETITAGGSWHGELVNRRKDGTLYTQEMTITAVPAAVGEVDYFIAVMQDVTDRRRIEDQLRQAQKMEAVGRLAGGVAHDFNNLLQAMLGLTELAQKSGHRSDQETLQLRELERHIQRASQLTRQLLLFSRPEGSRQELLNLNQVVGETVLLLGRLLREHIELEFKPCDQPLAVEADRGQLEQVVMNLAVNASDAMPDGGRLVIQTGGAGDDEVWLEFQDTGHGIPDEVREHLFEPFFTTKERGRGTGLGLSVVHGIVSHHGGSIAINSKPGSGTTFRVILPAADPSRLPTAPVEKPPVASAGDGERILIIEDDGGVRDSLREILTGLGYDVTTTANCKETERLAEEPGFDLLLSDFGLPDGTGTEIAAQMQIRWPDLKVIIMSGYAEDDVIARHLLSGDLHFLQKPFTVQTLGRAVQSVLKQDRPAAPSDPPSSSS